MFDPKTIKAVAVDCDGTLINAEEKLSPRTKEALAAFKATGRELYMATGRSTAASLYFAKEAGIEEYLITYNGAVIWNISQAKKIQELVIAPETARVVRDILFNSSSSYIFYTNDTPVYEAEGAEMSRYLQRISGMGLVPEYRDLGRFSYESVQKCIAFGENDAILRVRDLLAEACGPSINILVTRPYAHNTAVNMDYTFMEMMHPRVDKGFMLAELAALRGFSMANILAFGDDINDIGMLTSAGWGVAMGNGRDEVKAIADDTTLWHNEDGIAVYLEKYFL